MMVLGPLGGCNTSPPEPKPPAKSQAEASPAKASAAEAPDPPGPAAVPVAPLPARRPRAFKVVHVFVALCDNAHQGIVKVPTALGNGQARREAAGPPAPRRMSLRAAG